MLDNSDLQKKIEIRHSALRRFGIRPDVVLELFAGEGIMTRLIWSAVATRVICVEKDKDKAANIMGSSEIHIGNNINFIHLADQADIIDCDAYGLVMPLIASLPPGKLVIFTDGTPYAATKKYRFHSEFSRNIKALFSECYYELSRGNTAYYGWGVTK